MVTELQQVDESRDRSKNGVRDIHTTGRRKLRREQQ